jgi:hypothetical protein
MEIDRMSPCLVGPRLEIASEAAPAQVRLNEAARGAGTRPTCFLTGSVTSRNTGHSFWFSKLTVG